jgi:hypothetical protein
VCDVEERLSSWVKDIWRNFSREAIELGQRHMEAFLSKILLHAIAVQSSTEKIF